MFKSDTSFEGPPTPKTFKRYICTVPIHKTIQLIYVNLNFVYGVTICCVQWKECCTKVMGPTPVLHTLEPGVVGQ